MIWIIIAVGIAGFVFGVLVTEPRTEVKTATAYINRPRPPRHAPHAMLACCGAWITPETIPSNNPKSGDIVGWFSDTECWVENRHYVREGL